MLILVGGRLTAAIRHSFHDLARQQRVPDAVVKAMAGRSGAEVTQRGSDKHLHYSRGVTVEEMRQAWIALMIDYLLHHNGVRSRS